MKNIILSIAFLFAGGLFLNAQDLDAGKTLFKSNCAACHTVGKGKLTGPDLKDVSKRLDAEWINAFVKNSTAVIESGDEYANQIFNEFGKTVMTAHPHLTDGDISNIIAYIDEESLPKEVAVVPTTGGGQMNSGEMQIINDTANSAIDMPVVKMVFWGSVLIVSAILISLSLILVRLLK